MLFEIAIFEEQSEGMFTKTPFGIVTRTFHLKIFHERDRLAIELNIFIFFNPNTDTVVICDTVPLSRFFQFFGFIYLSF